MNYNEYEGIKETLFPVFESPVIYDTPKGDIDTGYKLILNKDTHNIISCVTDNYKLISNKEVMDVALPILKKKGGTLTEAKSFNEARTMWKFRFKDTKVKIDKGDYVNPEVIIKNSYDGSTEVQAMGCAYRLICSNGMIVGYTVNKKSARHVVWNQNNNIDSIVTNVIESVRKIFDSEFPLMVNTEINKNDIIRTMKLFPTQAISSFTQHVLKKELKTYWDLFNAATWTATHAMKRDYEATHKIESQIFPLMKKMVKSANVAKA